MREYQHILIKEIDMNSIADGSIIVQASSQSVPSTPPWFGEVTLIVQYLQKHHILSALTEHVRFARRRFGQYEVIDLSSCALRLCSQWRTHAGSLLRASVSFCLGLYGTLRTRAFAGPLHPQSLSRGSA